MPVFMRTVRVNKKKVLLLGICVFAAVYGVCGLLAGRGGDTSVLSWTVADRIVVIDPGHGGRDPGVVEGAAVEKEITLQVARKLHSLMNQAGAFTILTRESDQLLKDTEGKKFATYKAEDMYCRVKIANRQNADILVSLHVNSYREGTNQHGAQTFYRSGSEKGQALAESIQEQMLKLLGNNNRKAKPLDNKYILEKTDMPSVIVEMGFLTNPRERQLLQDSEYQGKIAYAICSGIVKYFEEHGGEKDNANMKPDPKEVFSEPPYHLDSP